MLACAPRPPTRASAIAPPTPALGGPGHARAAPALLQEWHPRCQPAGRTSRVAGPVLFACGDYSSRCAHISNPAHQSAHTRADSALFDHGPPQQETADPTRHRHPLKVRPRVRVCACPCTCTCACACECVARRRHTRRAVGRAGARFWTRRARFLTYVLAFGHVRFHLQLWPPHEIASAGTTVPGDRGRSIEGFRRPRLNLVGWPPHEISGDITRIIVIVH